jgi:magnesium-transporting ATPase (P-type)
MQADHKSCLAGMPCTLIPWDRMDREYLATPRKWQADDIARFMLFIGPISSVFDIITYLVMWHVFGANSVDSQSLFQPGWFVEGLLSQILIVHMIHTEKIPFFQSTAAPPVVLLTTAIMAVGIAIPSARWEPQWACSPCRSPTFRGWAESCSPIASSSRQ